MSVSRHGKFRLTEHIPCKDAEMIPSPKNPFGTVIPDICIRPAMVTGKRRIVYVNGYLGVLLLDYQLTELQEEYVYHSMLRIMAPRK